MISYGQQPRGLDFGSELKLLKFIVFGWILANGYSTALMTSLKNHSVEREVDGMFDMGAETMDLPLEEKMKYHPGDKGQSIG